jgi:hypothetical protein
MVNLELKGFKNLTQKTNKGEAGAASEVILENDSIALRRRRMVSPTGGGIARPALKKSSSNISAIASSVTDDGPKS